MAEALVGSSFLSAFLQVLFDRMASRQVVEFFKGRNSDGALRRKLETTVNSVWAMVDDAEEKQFTKQVAVKRWLHCLIDALYEADDVLDEIGYEDLRLKMETTSPTIADKFKGEMETKLEEIIEKLEHLVEQKDKLGLREGVREKPWLSSQCRIPTTSLLDKSGVYGRDADKEALMELLLTESNALDEIPIVGMGGIGKTTLAQLVYNDSRLQGLFDFKVWVFVSVEFDVFRVTKDILKELRSVNCDITTENQLHLEFMTENQLHLELEKRVKGKKFLLVLDDVWNDKYEDWDCLRKPLKSGAKGSKIVITTRNESVASIMCTVPIHQLKELMEDDCWLLFVKHAFGDGNSSMHPELEVIGREIVRKCRGLPLAAKVLGGLLGSKRDAKEWRKILNNNMWNASHDHILLALRLSYYYLPSHLKRCFAYCALFPQNYEFLKEELILLWMAEGLIVPTQGNEEMEEVGDEYFNDLVSRSFFQHSSDSRSCFVMHDLINDLAKFVAGEFFLRLENIDATNFSSRTRHLSYITEDDVANDFKSICEAKFLRTFLHIDDSVISREYVTDEVLHDFLQMHSCLRILSLSSYANLFKIPNSIGCLKHLRYLNLHGTMIKKLPESVTALYYLQTLILSHCYYLVKLPTDMAKLISLCHLDISRTKFREMPLQMGRLRKLQCLTDFFLAKRSGSSIKELGELKHLRGRICIWDLQHVGVVGDASATNFKGKKYLTGLELRWGGDTENSEHERDVLEELQPHTNLEHLSICDYGGTRFPNWIGDSSFSNIISLRIIRCKYCSSLPPLGQLASLKKLMIKGCEEIVVIGPEFYRRGTSTTKPFRLLESLWLENMPAWREWIICGDEDEGGAFPLLKELRIRRCPELTKTLPSYLPSLTTLEFAGREQLVYSIPMRPPILDRMVMDCCSAWVELERLQSGLLRLSTYDCDFLDLLLERMKLIGYSSCIQEIEINCPKLRLLPNQMHSLLPSLVSMRIYDCSEVDSFPDVGLPSKLESLEIRRCDKLIACRGDWNLQMLSSLSHFNIKENDDLECFPEESLLPSSTLTSLEIWGLRNLKSLDCKVLRQFTCLKKLKILDCPKLQIQSLAEEGLHHLTSLEELSIGICQKFRSMPKEGLPSSLTFLHISNLPHLTSLDCKGLQQLTSLKKLWIEHCLRLECIPQEGLPPALSALIIYYCPMLEQRCERENGADWPKISRIPHIQINGKIINVLADHLHA